MTKWDEQIPEIGRTAVNFAQRHSSAGTYLEKTTGTFHELMVCVVMFCETISVDANGGGRLPSQVRLRGAESDMHVTNAPG